MEGPRVVRGSFKLSVIAPAYNEESNIGEFLRQLLPVLESISTDYEVIFAVDPCSDRTSELIVAAHEADPRIKLLEFSRRFGQPVATLAGLGYSSGQVSIVMDCDLQDPPVLIVDLVAKWREGFDVVYAERRQRAGETVIKKFVSKIGYAFINRFADVPIPRNTGDFRLLDQKVVRELLKFPESNSFLRGLVALVGFRQTSVVFDRPGRFAGKGNYNRFFGSLRIGFNGVVAYSTALLNLSTLLGGVAAVLALVTAFAYFILKLAGQHFPIGNPTIVCLVLGLGGLQLICIGIIGLYIGRIYEDVKRRPRFIVSREIGFKSSASTEKFNDGPDANGEI